MSCLCLYPLTSLTYMYIITNPWFLCTYIHYHHCDSVTMLLFLGVHWHFSSLIFKSVSFGYIGVPNWEEDCLFLAIIVIKPKSKKYNCICVKYLYVHMCMHERYMLMRTVFYNFFVCLQKEGSTKPLEFPLPAGLISTHTYLYSDNVYY